MTNSEYAELVRRLEVTARKTPFLYRSQVLFFALLGNAYFLAVLALLVAAVVFLIMAITTAKVVAFKLLIFVAPVCWLTVKSLHIKFIPPDGVAVTLQQAPELFRMIDAVRHELKAPRCSHVLISDEINASVAQIPRFGFFGGYRNYLVIGLPLMQALTVAQLRAVLAHEFAHLAGGHTHFSRWIYSQRRRWGQLMAGLAEHDGRGSFLFKPFLNWFIPVFNAYSFPLARANEYEADAASVRLAGAPVVAEALTGIRAASHFMHEAYWPRIHEQVATTAQPAFMPFSTLPVQMGSDLEPMAAQAWIDADMAEATGIDDTHPALAERLAAVGAPPRLALPAPGESAEQLLGGAADEIAQRFDRNWQERIQPSWEKRYQEIQSDRETLATLNARHEAAEPLSLQEAYDRALLTERVGNDAEAALAQLQALRDRAPDDATILLTLGVRLLQRDEEEQGLPLIEQAAQIDADLAPRVYEIRRDHCWRKGQIDEAREWHEKALAHADIDALARAERDNLLMSDRFESHALPAETWQELRRALLAIDGLKAAYFARKHVEHYPDRACYVLGYSVTSTLQWHNKSRAREVLQKIQASVRFPGETLIICVDRENRRFGRKLHGMKDSRIV